MSDGPSPTFTQVSELVPLRVQQHLRVPVDEWDTMRERLEALDCEVHWVPMVVGAFVGAAITEVATAFSAGGMVHLWLAVTLVAVALALVFGLSEKRKTVKVQKQGILDLFDAVEDRHGFPPKQAPGTDAAPAPASPSPQSGSPAPGRSPRFPGLREVMRRDGPSEG